MNAPILETRDALRAAVTRWRKAGETIAVVPTMGALHAGHLSLVSAAKAACDRVIVTIFVNPKQFNQASDLENYPRTEQEDARKLAPFSVDLIYVPDVTQIYGAGFATNVSVGNMTDVLCGADRPGHFDGVATVVSKLFLQTSADKAFFGEKDFQQLMVVRRMARDLDIPIDVIGCPTVRESDGLAMSSRNLLLSEDARSTAPVLQDIMQDVNAKLASGAAFEPLQDAATTRLLAQGFSKVDYFDLRSQATLAPLSHPTEPARLFAAAWLDGVRLIDNIDVPILK